MLKSLYQCYPRLVTAWMVLSSVTTVLVISLGLAYGTVRLFHHPDGPVIAVTDFELHTPVIETGDQMVYSAWRRSFESCPGDIVTTFTPYGVKDKARHIFTIRRPMSLVGYNSPPRIVFSIDTPPLPPGKWEVQVSADSRCPTRTRLDKLFAFTLEVIPDDGKP